VLRLRGGMQVLIVPVHVANVLCDTFRLVCIAYPLSF
jgi:hypothetical protein